MTELRTDLLALLQHLKGWRLWLLTVTTSVILAEACVSVLHLLLTGEIPALSLLVGLIASLFVASLVTAIATWMLDRLAESQNDALKVSAQRAESRLGIAVEATQLLFWEFDIANDELSYDEALLTLLGMDAIDAPHSIQAWCLHIHPEDLPVFMAHFQATLTNPDNSYFDLEYRISQRSQPWGWVHSKGRIIQRDATGQALLAVGTTLNITARKQAETELREAKERFELIFKHNPNAMLISRLPEGIITNVNDAFSRITGHSRTDAIGNTTLGLHLWTSADDREKMIHQMQTRGICENLEAEFQIKNGQKGMGLLSAVITRLQGIPHIVSTIHDITDQKKSQDLIWNQANFDTLTQLPNRRMFHDRLMQELKKAHRASLQLGLLFIDLDHFKEVNDRLGHDLGDVLLTEAARRISACVRESDTVARLGGDEFTVILAELEETSHIERISESIIQALEKPFQLGHELAYISASIGITLYPDDAGDLEGLLRNADQAMYVAKNAGRNRYSYFTLAVQEAAQDRLNMMKELQGALAAGEFRLFYQPVVDLMTGRIRKAEALLRWQHPLRGIIGPAEFIPLIEDSGLIHEIGDRLFREAARQVRQWRLSFDRDFQVSVNLSPIQFQASANTAQWFEELPAVDIAGQSLIFEITEKLLLDPPGHIAARLLSFREAGIELAVDGCGSGFSPLIYLK